MASETGEERLPLVARRRIDSQNECFNANKGIRMILFALEGDRSKNNRSPDIGDEDVRSKDNIMQMYKRGRYRLKHFLAPNLLLIILLNDLVSKSTIQKPQKPQSLHFHSYPLKLIASQPFKSWQPVYRNVQNSLHVVRFHRHGQFPNSSRFVQNIIHCTSILFDRDEKLLFPPSPQNVLLKAERYELMLPLFVAISSLLENGRQGVYAHVILISDLVADLPKSGGPDGSMEVVVLVEPCTDDASSRTQATNLDTFAPPSSFTGTRCQSEAVTT